MWSDKACDVFGYPLRYWRKGRGPALVILSGAGGPEIMVPLAEDLAQNFDVILPEHPGFGAADAPPWCERVPDLAYFYAEAFEALRLKDFALVGHSLGGWIAAEIAVRDAHALRALVLVSAAGISVPGAPPADNFLWSRAEMLKRFFFDPAFAQQALDKPFTDEQLGLNLKRLQCVARLVWKPRWHNPELQRWLHRIKTPTRIIWGKDDNLFPAAYAAAFQTAIPGATLDIIKECGHLPFIEQPDAFKRSLLSGCGVKP